MNDIVRAWKGHRERFAPMPKYHTLVALPNKLVEMIERFRVDKRTGNIQLNCREGVILGFKTEELHSLDR